MKFIRPRICVHLRYMCTCDCTFVHMLTTTTTPSSRHLVWICYFGGVEPFMLLEKWVRMMFVVFAIYFFLLFFRFSDKELFSTFTQFCLFRIRFAFNLRKAWEEGKFVKRNVIEISVPPSLTYLKLTTVASSVSSILLLCERCCSMAVATVAATNNCKFCKIPFFLEKCD